MVKSTEEIILDVLNAPEDDSLVFANEKSVLASELFESIDYSLNYVTNGNIETSSPEDDIYQELNNSLTLLLNNQNKNTKSSMDELVIAFFKLGQTLGRQQVIRRHIFPLRKIIEERIQNSSGGIKATENRIGADYVASKLLDDFLKNHPDKFDQVKNKIKRGVKAHLKLSLINVFTFEDETGIHNCKICGYYQTMSDKTATQKMKNAVERYIEKKTLNYPKELIEQIII